MNEKPYTGIFWAKVQMGAPEECWPWKGYVKPSGHGLTSYQSRAIHTHRKAWILAKGPIRRGLCVNHLCDNQLCCNPAHLYLGTRAANMVDRFEKISGERAPGRRTVLSPVQLSELYQARTNGMKLTECAEKFGVHVATICRYVTAIRREKLAKLKEDRLATPSRKSVYT